MHERSGTFSRGVASKKSSLTCARKLRMSPAFEGDMANGKATPQAFAHRSDQLRGTAHDRAAAQRGSVMCCPGEVSCQSPRALRLVCEVERSGTERIDRRSVSADDPRSRAEWSVSNRGVWLSSGLRKGDDIDGGLPRMTRQRQRQSSRWRHACAAGFGRWGVFRVVFGRAGKRGGCLSGSRGRVLYAGEGANPGL